jgi:ABC-type multidrug transport system fused ATPase/permease subunit
MKLNLKQMTETKKRKITKASLQNLWKLYHYILPYRFEFIIGIILLMLSSLPSLAFPYLVGKLFDAGDKGLYDQITFYVLILAGLLIFQALFSYFRVVLFVNVTEKSLAALRQATYNHLIKLPVKFFEKRRVGELNSRISSDISLLQETMTTTLAELIRQLIIIFGGIVVLGFISVNLTLFMLAIIPGMMLLAVYFGRFIRKFSKKTQQEVADSNTIVEETLQGIKSVKAYTNEFFEMLRYKKRTNEIAKIAMKAGKYRGAFSAFIILGLFGAIVAVVWRGSVLLAHGEFDPGDLFSFVLYSGFIGGTIGGLANVIASIQKFIGATEDLFEIFDEEEEAITSNEKWPQKDLAGRISFENVSFAYPSRPDEHVLHKISLEISENQLIALVGPSGAGKSTFATLLLQFHLPDHGNILFDGKLSINYPLSFIRSQIALVPQDIFLFGGSIRENIAYGKPDASEEEIVAAAEKANAMEFINRFPEKLDTIVGERGTQLSGGQRQRVAIARAVLKNPKILILDEATSSLDSESERLVQDALEKLMKGRTSIVIAHRLSTIRNADQILVLDKGHIVEKGTHEELLQLENGIYKGLSELQYTA